MSVNAQRMQTIEMVGPAGAVPVTLDQVDTYKSRGYSIREGAEPKLRNAALSMTEAERAKMSTPVPFDFSSYLTSELTEIADGLGLHTEGVTRAMLETALQIQIDENDFTMPRPSRWEE